MILYDILYYIALHYIVIKNVHILHSQGLFKSSQVLTVTIINVCMKYNCL